MPHALPDAEVFYHTSKAIERDNLRDYDGKLMEQGWYYWFCFPGCLPDSVQWHELDRFNDMEWIEAVGPFPTKQAALDDAQDGYED